MLHGCMTECETYDFRLFVYHVWERNWDSVSYHYCSWISMTCPDIDKIFRSVNGCRIGYRVGKGVFWIASITVLIFSKPPFGGNRSICMTSPGYLFHSDIPMNSGVTCGLPTHLSPKRFWHSLTHLRTWFGIDRTKDSSWFLPSIERFLGVSLPD